VAVSEVSDITISVDRAQHANDIAEAVSAAVAGLRGCVRATLDGELGPAVALDLNEINRLGAHLDGMQVRTGRISVGYDLEAIAAEMTVRGQFVRDAQAQIPDADQRRRIVLTGLRALEGRADLEVA
jgi:hypothetical protein